jgi:23S rRNA pseudoU1915 N3-methylase RlmH
MGNNASFQKVNFENIQEIIKTSNNKADYVLINTLPSNQQECLIPTTIIASDEESIMNKHLTKNKNIKIIIYGKNCSDSKLTQKYAQLNSLGFSNIYIYIGGLFEWLLLQDIYGQAEFPTTSKQLDLLKYNSERNSGIFM